ncbi:hypothetical protein BMR10_15300, partial [Methylococcaceae bacterium CS4]
REYISLGLIVIVGNVLVSVGKGWITFFRYPCFINTPAGNQYILHMNGTPQNLWNAVCGTSAVSSGRDDSLQKAQGCCQSEVRDSARGRLKFYPE